MATATVIICTHNRADFLARAVAAAFEEAARNDAEVLVVDNASTDATVSVLAALARERPGDRLRTTTEPELGLSRARNRGLANASGPIAVFLDDDAVPRPGWLAAMLAPYARASVVGVGGPVRVAFSGLPPDWLAESLYPALGCFDAGRDPCQLRYGRQNYPLGCNISFRVEPVRAVGGFSADMGLRGRTQIQHEETDVCYRLEARGGEIHYAPDAIVDHWVVPEKLTPEWFLTRYEQAGRSFVPFIVRNRGRARALWRLRWWYGRDLLRLPYAPHDPIDPARFAAECRRREALGYVAGLARHALGKA